MPQEGPQHQDGEERCGKHWQEAKQKTMEINSKTLDRKSSITIFLKE